MTATWALRVANACRLAAGVVLCGAIHQATAATFVVTTTTDSNDGACTVSLCSLRDAIIASNATPGSNVITLPAGTYALTIAGANENLSATGDLDINSNGLTINGAGAVTTIVDGGALDRVFEIHTSPVVFNGLTIRNGAPPANQDGGAILNDGTLTLNNCIISGNRTTGTGKGGGIWTNNDLTLNNTTVSGNTAGGNGGGIDNEDTVHINTSSISGNAAGAGADGGGIYDAFGALTINDTTVSGNTASGGGRGAGVFENGNAAVINRSTFSGNSTDGNGGGFFVNGQPLTLTNVTISGNAATSGGGLFNNGNALHIVASTIASNTGGGIANNGVADATGTIIANNDINCTLASITDSGTNLQFPGTTCGLSVTSADPLLQPLASNGGPTQTRAIPASSPAVDANTEVCPPTPPTDQRGVTRPQGPHCDIGAFELAAPGLPTLSIDNVSANEGNSGTTPFTFTVTLSAASASTVTVNFATADGTATAGSDYTATSGVLTFTPGQTTQTVTVSVLGDTTVEPSETFFVNLSGPSNATIAAGQGTGTIVNDDVPVVGPATIIPTLDARALALLALLLAGLAALALRRRR